MLETESYNYEKIIFTKKIDGVCTKFQIKKPNFKLINFIFKHSLTIIVLFIVSFYTLNFNIALIFTIIFLLYTYVKLNSIVIKEELFFIPSIGVQELSIHGTGRKDIKFYAHSQIKDLVITESVSTLRVIFYLCLICQNEQKKSRLQPLFIGTKPKLDVLRQIYKETNHYFK
ncbi:phosphatidylinositol N-acetylglucosaminyltransferase subunit H [Brachionus plicatilis]|uniref:Phosphatidylinositol N-acetylglucosaminyltransferase subunit H n=1 Tax=Brachionus plicatilis TaxID=10195 RepID=A0A3M7RV93_BRAPC|nr:phosphatidylinositol N-acetylglucosaminyltransferase subunit H [Brachionus plicatilis]